MIQNRRNQVKQTSIPMSTRNREPIRLFSHKKNSSRNLLQKKPQILLMKWNDFLEKYHFYKQLTAINSSLNTSNLNLKRKKQELAIRNVPYIMSEQISVDEKYIQERQKTMIQKQISSSILYQQIQTQNIIIPNQSSIINTIKCSSKQQINSYNYKSIAPKEESQDKIVISLRLSQSKQQKKSLKQDEQDYQNFTDNEQNSEQDKKSQLQSTNKNSKIQLSSINQGELGRNRPNLQASFGIGENLLQTAYFSFNSNALRMKNQQDASQQNKNKGQQNINNSNNIHLKSRKVEVLLKLHNEQYNRKQSNKKIFEQDKQFLNKFISKK